MLKLQKLSDTAVLPTKGSKLAAAYDLASSVDCIILAGTRGLVDIGWAMSCPEGTYGRIAPRSGLACKKSIDIGAGVIDADYTGPVKVLIINNGSEDVAISIGDRIAQLILERIIDAPIVVVESLTETERGDGGFGSTGVSSSEEKKES